MSAPRPDIPLTFIEWRSAGDVVTLVLNRPQAGNALNWAMLEQLRQAVHAATDSPDAQAIVIAAAGNRFVSGADLSFFVRCLEAGDIRRIVECIRASQEVFEQIASCPKPVVAAVPGAAVGGGVELALACHYIVATPRASFSFPETSLGIAPFSGGTYRTPARIGPELTKWLVYTGHLLAPPKALKLGLIDELVMPDQLDLAAPQAALRLRGALTRQRTEREPADGEFAAVRALFAAGDLNALRRAEPPDDRTAAAALKAVAARPPAALQWCERLIDAAGASTTVQGAQAALAAVPALFADPQVRIRLARVAQQQRQG